MTEEKLNVDKLLSTIESQELEIGKLKLVEEELKEIKEIKEADEKKALVEKLVELTKKEASHWESKSIDILKELLEALPEPKVKETPKAKGVVENVKEKGKVEKELFEQDEHGNLTMTNEYFEEFDNGIRNLDFIENYKWISHKEGE